MNLYTFCFQQQSIPNSEDDIMTIAIAASQNMIGDSQWTNWTDHKFQNIIGLQAQFRIRWTLESIVVKPKNIFLFNLEAHL